MRIGLGLLVTVGGYYFVNFHKMGLEGTIAPEFGLFCFLSHSFYVGGQHELLSLHG